MGTSAQACQAGVEHREVEIGASGTTTIGVLIHVQISHADRLVADQALQAGDNAMAQARHGAEGWHTAEYGGIIHRRHIDRGAAEVDAGGARSQIKAQPIIAIAIAGGGEAENATGLQVAIEGSNRAHQGQLGASAPRHADARATAGAEAAAGVRALAHRHRQRLGRIAAIGIGQQQGAQVERRRGVLRGGDRRRQVAEGGGVIAGGHRNAEAVRGRGVRQTAAVVGDHQELARRRVWGLGTVGVAHQPQGGLEVVQGGRGIGSGLDQQRTSGGVVSRR